MAFVLALTVRCFVVEAYKIPTGSMAPTLYGDHLQITCPVCGTQFTVRGADGSEFLGSFECPSCGAEVTPTAGTVRVLGGDRILVAKDIYQFVKPARWDVFVFKSPEPGKQNMNFVKRLVGLPGETLVLKGGQVFIDGLIARKPPRVQDELWQPVYDMKSGSRENWRPDGNWQVRPEGLLLADAPEARQTVEYVKPILDFYPYNGREGENVVGDLLVSGHVKFEGDAGSFAAAVYDDTRTVKALFVPEVNALLVQLRENEALVRQESSIVASPREFDFSVSSVDGATEVTINGISVFRHESDLGPDDVAMFTRSSGVFFEGVGARMLVSAVDIRRDVYYRASLRRPDRNAPGPYVKEIPLGYYLGLGDNSPISNDSREWGLVPYDNVLGKAFFLFWPPARMKPVH
jgi:signal peptidase I